MKSPTKEQIEEALKFAHEISVQAGQTNPNRPYTYDALDILAAAYRATLARAELAEWHERESVAWVEAIGMMPEQWADLQARHERERKELET